MQKIAEKQGFLKKPRKHLISSYFGEEIEANTVLLHIIPILTSMKQSITHGFRTWNN